MLRNSLNFLSGEAPQRLATMLLWVGLAGAHMACLLPQDDQIITELPQAANRPLRVLQNLAFPEQRETVAKFGTSCPPPVFSVKVDDPNLGDTIRSQWFIDPIERYIGGVPGNPVTLDSAGSTVRTVNAVTQFTSRLKTLTDGKKHRVEVVVTDGEFIESQGRDANGEPQPYLDITRPAFRTPTGEEIKVLAYRDDYVWLVEIDTAPCR
jgi:hypothetical protein